MKKLWLLLIIIAMATSTAVAQEQKVAKQQDRTEWEKKIKDELKLTEEQTEKFNALNKEYNAKMDAIMNDASLNKEAQKEKKMALKKEKETKFFEFITLEQQATYKQLMDKRKKEMAPKSGT